MPTTHHEHNVFTVPGAAGAELTALPHSRYRSTAGRLGPLPAVLLVELCGTGDHGENIAQFIGGLLVCFAFAVNTPHAPHNLIKTDFLGQ